MKTIVSSIILFVVGSLCFLCRGTSTPSKHEWDALPSSSKVDSAIKPLTDSLYYEILTNSKDCSSAVVTITYKMAPLEPDKPWTGYVLTPVSASASGYSSNQETEPGKENPGHENDGSEEVADDNDDYPESSESSDDNSGSYYIVYLLLAVIAILLFFVFKDRIMGLFHTHADEDDDEEPENTPQRPNRPLNGGKRPKPGETGKKAEEPNAKKATSNNIGLDKHTSIDKNKHSAADKVAEPADKDVPAHDPSIADEVLYEESKLKDEDKYKPVDYTAEVSTSVADRVEDSRPAPKPQIKTVRRYGRLSVPGENELILGEDYLFEDPDNMPFVFEFNENMSDGTYDLHDPFRRTFAADSDFLKPFVKPFTDNPSARDIKTVKPGRLVRSQDGWKVTEKLTIELI